MDGAPRPDLRTNSQKPQSSHQPRLYLAFFEAELAMLISNSAYRAIPEANFPGWCATAVAASSPPFGTFASCFETRRRSSSQHFDTLKYRRSLGHSSSPLIVCSTQSASQFGAGIAQVLLTTMIIPEAITQVRTAKLGRYTLMGIVREHHSAQFARLVRNKTSGGSGQYTYPREHMYACSSGRVGEIHVHYLQYIADCSILTCL